MSQVLVGWEFVRFKLFKSSKLSFSVAGLEQGDIIVFHV